MRDSPLSFSKANEANPKDKQELLSRSNRIKDCSDIESNAREYSHVIEHFDPHEHEDNTFANMERQILSNVYLSGNVAENETTCDHHWWEDIDVVPVVLKVRLDSMN
jgi:hypothetical protein